MLDINRELTSGVSKLAIVLTNNILFSGDSVLRILVNCIAYSINVLLACDRLSRQWDKRPLNSRNAVATVESIESSKRRDVRPRRRLGDIGEVANEFAHSGGSCTSGSGSHEHCSLVNSLLDILNPMITIHRSTTTLHHPTTADRLFLLVAGGATFVWHFP